MIIDATRSGFGYGVWSGGVRDRKGLSEDVIGHTDTIADAARAGDWDQVPSLVGHPPRSIELPDDYANSTRIGGSGQRHMVRPNGFDLVDAGFA
ncbi:hypothetical protein ACQP1O_10125 [Nocardia sp. CA-151230]|uniref:hypothetical protein n=1 Tax=Nocardia sp. CA-151230 TaxID=3239982 RepID=UPI003D8BA070